MENENQENQKQYNNDINASRPNPSTDIDYSNMDIDESTGGSAMGDPENGDN